MKNLMRTLTLSAAALAALVAAPKSNAQEFRRGGGARDGPRKPGSRAENFRGGDSVEETSADTSSAEAISAVASSAEAVPRPAFVRPPAFSYGRRYVAPFRVFAGSRFYSYCPGPDYIYVDDLGWVFPPFVGAVWVPRFDPFGVRIGGFWR